MGILEQAKALVNQVPRGDYEPQFSGSFLSLGELKRGLAVKTAFMSLGHVLSSCKCLAVLVVVLIIIRIIGVIIILNQSKERP